MRWQLRAEHTQVAVALLAANSQKAGAQYPSRGVLSVARLSEHEGCLGAGWPPKIHPDSTNAADGRLQ